MTPEKLRAIHARHAREREARRIHWLCGLFASPGYVVSDWQREFIRDILR